MEPAETGEAQQKDRVSGVSALVNICPSVCPSPHHLSFHRYLDCLKKSVKKGAFDTHEVELLKKLVEKHGVGEVLMMMMLMQHQLTGSELSIDVF